MQVSAAASTGQASAVTNNRGMSALSSEDFMNLLIKQLQLQDPMEPMGDEEMMKQMAIIRELEMNTRLTERLEQLTDQQRFGSAAVLIGRHVKGTLTDANGNKFTVEGQVQSVVFTSKGEIMLELDTGQTLPLAKLEEVKDPPAAAAATAGADPAASNSTATSTAADVKTNVLKTLRSLL